MTSPLRTHLHPSAAAFIDENRHAPRTSENYDYAWERWTRFCSALGFPALGAPMDAYRALWAAATTGVVDPHPRRGPRHPGEPLSLSQMDVTVAAIRSKHALAGVVPSFRLPEHAAEARDLRAGYARMLAGLGYVAESAKPLRPADLRALLGANPPITDAALRATALVLVAMRTGCSWSTLTGLTVKDLVDPESPFAGGFDLSFARGHTCSTSVVRHSCLACILEGLREQADLRLASDLTGYAWRRTRDRICRAWIGLRPSADGGFVRDDDLSGEQWNFVFEGVATHLAHRKAWAVAGAQARAGLAWSLGLRSRDEPNRLRVADVRVADSGAIRITLHSAKNDQGRQGVTFGLDAPIHDRDPSATLARWIGLRSVVRDTCPDQPLFCSASAWGEPKPHAVPSLPHKSFSTLQSWCGLHGFTMHSTRTGFAVSATEAGIGERDIQTTLRIADTTLANRYARKANTAAGAPVSVLVSALGDQR